MSRKSVARRRRKTSTKKKKKIVRTMEYAVIPECQNRSYANNEYTTSREEKMWDPKVDVEGWFPAYDLVAKFVLTHKQQYQGISSIEAMENSCTGDAGQYISDVLHEAQYEPHDALRMICMKDIPQKIIEKWKPEEMQLFTEGIMKHGKNFSIIRREMLPHKRVEDFAEFYYVWKRSSMAEAWKKLRAEIKAEELKRKKRRSKEQTNEPTNEPTNQPLCNVSNNKPLCNLSSNRIMTRSATAAANLSLQNSMGTDDDSKASTSTSQSEKDEEATSAAESTDSSMEHVEKPCSNDQECPKQRHKRKLSIPRKIVNFEEESAGETEEIMRDLAPIIPQWKRQRKCKHVV